MIKKHIELNTEIGRKLKATKKSKSLQSADEYSPVHYELDLVFELLQDTIKQAKESQKFIILEGLCNSGRLAQEDQRLELRYMDELFLIEKVVGEVSGIVSLQYEPEKEYTEENEIEYEVFPEPEVVEVKKVVGEDGEEIPQEETPVEEDKKPKFKPEQYNWTVTDRKSKNLPQLFLQTKGIGASHELRLASSFNEYELYYVSKCLDEFAQRIIDKSTTSEKYLYQQVIFPNKLY